MVPVNAATKRTAPCKTHGMNPGVHLHVDATRFHYYRKVEKSKTSMQPERSTPRLRRFEVVSGLPLVLASFFFCGADLREPSICWVVRLALIRIPFQISF
jgi:hypothetical protein